MNPVFNKPLNNQKMNKENTSKNTPNEKTNEMPKRVSNDLLDQFIDMVFSNSIPEQENNNKNNTVREKKSEGYPEKCSEKCSEVQRETNRETNHKTQPETNHEVLSEKLPPIKIPTSATLDFKNNCIVIDNNKYYIERFTSDTNMTINRLVKLDNVFTIEQFAEKYINKKQFGYKILTKDLLIYFNKEQKFLVKLIDKNDTIKDYTKFFNCAYLKPDQETKPISDLLKMDQVIKAQAYFEFELKAQITYLENEIEYEVFNEVLDFLYNTDKETLKIAFKELIKCDKEYLSECALTGKFKKICIVDYSKIKRIYNN